MRIFFFFNNSAGSENVSGACEPNVHTHFIFRFQNGQGNKSFFLSGSMPKIQLKRVNHKLSRRTVDAINIVILLYLNDNAALSLLPSLIRTASSFFSRLSPSLPPSPSLSLPHSLSLSHSLSFSLSLSLSLSLTLSFSLSLSLSLSRPVRCESTRLEIAESSQRSPKYSRGHLW